MRWNPRTLAIAILSATAAIAPQNDTAAAQIPRLVTETSSPFDRQELLRRADHYEQAIPRAAAEHWPSERLALIYSDLATAYAELAMYPRSETAYRHALALLEARPPQPQLAETLTRLATLHCLMGNLGQAEKDDLRALKVRTQLGDPIAIALAWNDLADVYYRQRHFSRSADYARQAIAVLADDPKVDVANRIAVRQTLAHALCATQDCDQAIPILKDALQIAKTAYGAESLEAGIATYELGNAAWQNHDLDDAATWLAAGVARMKLDLGSGHRLYINALWEYVRFLRQRGQVEQADAAEREMRIAAAVVDVRNAQTVSP